MNEIVEVIYRLRKNQRIRAISRDLNLSRNTIRKYRAIAQEHGFLNHEAALPDAQTLSKIMGSPPPPKHMRSSIEPFAEQVENLLEAKVEMTAIWQRLCLDYGYTGSYSSLRRFVARNHPKKPEVVCRIETGPGEEAQVDFGYAGIQYDARSGRKRKAWAFVMTLSFSRHQYVEFVFDQKIESWLRCHENAFAWFGGVPERLVVDNLKSAVVKCVWPDAVLGEPYRRLAQHYGFLISPNRAHTPRHKGKVESGVHYVTRNFLAGRQFADLQAMNEQVKQWVLDIAGSREHGTTKQAPLKRFLREKETLSPLPAEPFDLLSTCRAKAHRDCHVTVQDSYYSVPARFVGQTLDVYVGRKTVQIFEDCKLVTTHPKAQERGQRLTHSEHYPKGKREYLDNPPERCRERAQQVGSACAKVIEGLLVDGQQERLRSVQSLLRRGETVGNERLEAACARAVHYGDPTYRRIKTILDAGLDSQPLQAAAAVPSAQQEGAAFVHARAPESFFDTEGGR